MNTDREHGIDAWWGCMNQSGLDLDTKGSVGRLRIAFRAALVKLSDEEFQRFWLRSPQIVCLTSRGKVIEVGELAIYLAPSILRMRDDRLVDVVAHEIAHVVLWGQPFEGNPANERAADDLVERWGFRRSYSRAALRRMSGG